MINKTSTAAINPHLRIPSVSGNMLNELNNAKQMKIRFFLFFIFIVLGFGSCIPINYLAIDLSEPAKQTLPDAVQSLTLISRAVDNRFTDDPADSVQIRFFRAQFQADTVIYDRKAADTLLQALGSLLYESGRYDVVIPVERFPNKDSVSHFTEPMEWKDVEKYTTDFNTDAVLSLDHFRTAIFTQYFESPVFDSNSGVYMAGNAEMEISYLALFRLYYPGNKDVSPSFLISDTLQWEDGDDDLHRLFRRFTYVKSGLTEAGIEAAIRLSEEISPLWKKSKRAYFARGHRVFIESNRLVTENDWTAAINLWKEMLDKTKSKSLRSKLEFNIAMANEMTGNLNEAIIWGVRSFKTMYRPVTYKYLETLKKRKLLFNKTDETN